MECNFEGFLTGPENQEAWTAATQMGRGESAGPLYLYGPNGTGKSHLIRAAAAELKKRNPEARIRCLLCDDFVADLVHAIVHDERDGFYEKYYRADGLFLDDIQMLAGKTSTQEELAMILRTLLAAGKPVMLAADRKPEALEVIQELLTLSSQASVFRLALPGAELRSRMIRNQCAQMGMTLSEPVHMLLVDHSRNFRQALGLCKRLLAMRDLEEIPLEPENVMGILEKLN